MISSAGYNRSRQDLIVAAITSNMRRRLFGDYIVADWTSAGLLLPSIVTGILRTIKQTMVERRLGWAAWPTRRCKYSGGCVAVRSPSSRVFRLPLDEFFRGARTA